MIITTSNVLSGRTPTISTGASTSIPSNITSPDFSLNYQSSDQLRLTADFGATGVINYIAVAGINIRGDGSGSARVRALDGATLIQTVNIKRNGVTVVAFEPQSFTNLRIGLYNGDGVLNPILTYAAAGVAITVPNHGENAGYDRQFLNRNIKAKTVINSMAAPITTLKKRIQANGNLALPNMTKAFSENEWQDFLDFASENVFFIREQDTISDNVNSGDNVSSYLCYDISDTKAKAHSSTRALNDLSISFKVYNGL